MTQPAPGQGQEVDGFQALLMRIQDEADLSDEEVSRLPIKQAHGPYEVGKPFPGVDAYLVVALFRGAQGERSTEDAHIAGEIRAYCVPIAGPTAETPPIRFTVYGLGTPMPYKAIDRMTPDTFFEEAGAELHEMAVLAHVIEEGSECPNEACQGLIPDEAEDFDWEFCPHCGTKLPSDEEPEATTPAPPMS